MLTASEIRRRFLDFFERRKHRIVQSGPLIPPDDPTLLFTNAGMVQFKEFFLGQVQKPFNRAASCQKCLRVSGKHNDLENVGRTARHHTFFEMLGNFSFGNYFKRDAITWAWEFVTEELKLPREKLWVTVYKDDDEAAAIWKEVANLPDDRIVRMDGKDNFWTMGDTGPCGPCSEIYIDQGEEMSCGPNCGIGKCDCDRFLEIWNLVFTQFDQHPDGTRTPLAAPNIDTGMGLERIAAVCQGKKSNFDCDLFQEIISEAAKLTGVKYSASDPDTNDVDTALRVMADHSRAAAFLIAEGVLPSNEGRGYVLRRLVRRALRFAALIGTHEPVLYKVAGKVCEVMGEACPELPEHREFMERVIEGEERRFAQTLQNGLALLEEEISRLRKEGSGVVPGEFCFKLHDTFGFPLDIVNDVAEKAGLGVDRDGFLRFMQEQKDRARAGQKKGGILGQSPSAILAAAAAALQPASTQFVGYDTLECDGKILGLANEIGELVEHLDEGARGFLATTMTPFYAASGGQAGDMGEISSAGGRARVFGAYKPVPDLIFQEIEVTAGEFARDQEVHLSVDPDIRLSTARNHTCTHLLHAALRRVLGTHVHQSGSLVDSHRLRFDFSHITAMTPSELSAVEREVNRAILQDTPVSACEMDREEAVAKGAMALFSEKYGSRVRVLTISGTGAEPESVELCGGTHLNRTGEAGSFYILSESAVAAGIRRIEAVTGWNAINFAIQQRSVLQNATDMAKSRPDQLAERIGALQEEIKKLRKEREAAPAISGGTLAKTAQAVGDINVLTANLGAMSVKSLRELMDDLRSRLSSHAVICLGASENGKVSLLLHVSKDIHDRFTAPALIKDVAALCGGSGGGRPDLAQAGGNRPEGINEAFALLKQKVEQ